MSGLLDQAGLTAGSGLSNGAGLYRWGNFNPFDPSDLDPYLLFDTQAGSMIGTLENPTLDLDPSNQETLEVITATRSSVATRTLPDGRIALAEQDTVRVDQTQGAELTPTKFQRVGYTDFSSGVTLDGVTKTNQSTPYGDGILLTQDTSSGEHNILVSVTNTGQHTFSLKVKPDGVTKFSLSLEFSTSNSEVVYDTVAETATIQGSNVSDASLEDLGSGWFLVKLTNDSTVSIARIRLRTDSGVVSYVGDGVSGLFLANPQVEEGTTASDFVANTTGSPKFITGATFGPRVPMILVEPSATNLVTYSEDFSNSYWTKSGTSSVTPNTTISPDGTLNADTISNATGTSTSDTVYRTINPDDVDHTFSAYVKSAGATTMSLITRNGINGVILSQAISLTDEWQRVTLTHNIQNGQLIFGGSDGDFHLWGAQFESGSVATSLIPTSGGNAAARTRAADDLSILGSQFTNFFNSGGDGTFYAEYQFNDADGANSLIYGSADNQRFAYKNAGSASPLISYDGTNVLSYGRLSAGTLLRTALSFDSNSMEGSQDGSAATMSGQTAPFPHNGNFRSATELSIGSDTTGGKQLNGHIKRLIFWPTHSSRM